MHYLIFAISNQNLLDENGIIANYIIKMNSSNAFIHLNKLTICYKIVHKFL